MNISVKNMDETTFRKLKITAMEMQKSVGVALTEAANEWINKNKKILSGLETIIDRAKTDKDVVAVILFGSYARKEPAFRDVDIAILLRGGKYDYIKKETTYWISDVFDISILNRLPLNIAARVLEEGKLLFVSDWDELEEFSMRIVKQWSDFKPLYNEIISSE
jgi:predicted nucleotidyltransferase